MCLLVSAVDGYSSDMNIHHGFPSKRYARIETHDFPEKFSIISRLKKESFIVGPGGDVLRSSVLPRVQVKVPEGAVSSGTKMTLQVSATALGPQFCNLLCSFSYVRRDALYR